MGKIFWESGMEVGRQDSLWGPDCSGNFPWREIAWQPCIWQPSFFWQEVTLATSNGIKSGREHERGGPKLEKLKRRKPREKKRREEGEEEKILMKDTVKLREIEQETKHLFTLTRLAFR